MLKNEIDELEMKLKQNKKMFNDLENEMDLRYVKYN